MAKRKVPGKGKGRGAPEDRPTIGLPVAPETTHKRGRGPGGSRQVDKTTQADRQPKEQPPTTRADRKRGQKRQK